jgi:hypothetical protein
MKTQVQPPFSARPSSLKLSAARLHSRIARRLTQGTSRRPAANFDSSLSLFNSLWSPLRLDLLKVPVSRHRE